MRHFLLCAGVRGLPLLCTFFLSVKPGSSKNGLKKRQHLSSLKDRTSCHQCICQFQDMKEALRLTRGSCIPGHNGFQKETRSSRKAVILSWMCLSLRISLTVPMRREAVALGRLHGCLFTAWPATAAGSQSNTISSLSLTVSCSALPTLSGIALNNPAWG